MDAGKGAVHRKYHDTVVFKLKEKLRVFMKDRERLDWKLAEEGSTRKDIDADMNKEKTDD